MGCFGCMIRFILFFELSVWLFNIHFYGLFVWSIRGISFKEGRDRDLISLFLRQRCGRWYPEGVLRLVFLGKSCFRLPFQNLVRHSLSVFQENIYLDLSSQSQGILFGPDQRQVPE